MLRGRSAGGSLNSTLEQGPRSRSFRLIHDTRIRRADYAFPTWYLVNPSDLYVLVRQREGRLYPDDVAVHLPDIPLGHPRRAEWLVRGESADRLLRHLAGRPRPLCVLDLGCGNGWLSHKVAALPEVRVWGLDRFGVELVQAARLFASDSTEFLSADIFHAPFRGDTFDAIILASVIQYFPDLPALIRLLRTLLSQRGEIYLLDSPLYSDGELTSAQARTRAYYSSLGLPEMADHYFHHTISSLEEFAPRWLYDPAAWHNRFSRYLGQRPSPFPWICIR